MAKQPSTGSLKLPRQLSRKEYAMSGDSVNHNVTEAFRSPIPVAVATTKQARTNLLLPYLTIQV